MKVKAILCVLSIFILFGCIHLPGRHEKQKSPWRQQKDRWDEEQKSDYEQLYEQEQKMARLVIKNSTSSTVYLVIDYTGRVKIPPGRRVSRTVTAGSHTLEAYDENGDIRYRARIHVYKYEHFTWSIGE